MNDPAAVVPAFPCEGQAAAEVAVELCTEVNQGLYSLWCLPNELLDNRSI
jgi:hypothetical protein